MQGYIKLHRQLLDNPLLNSEPYTRGQAWIAILLLTNHKDGFIQIKNGELIKIERGECGYSELALADIFKWSRGKVKRFLKLLESQKMIQQKNRANRTIIKVLNYDNYQNGTVNDTLNDTVNGHLTVHQTDINNNDNNDKNEKNDKKLDLYVNEHKQFFENQYKKVFNQKPYLSQQDCYRIIELSSYYNSEIIAEAIEKLKYISFDDINFKPTASWLLKDNNFERVMNGEFDKTENKQDNIEKMIKELEEKARKEGRI